MSTSDESRPRTLTSLRDLPGEIAPTRDLWPGIASQLDARPATEGGAASNVVSLRTTHARPRWMMPLALAATIGVLAVGIGIGRWSNGGSNAGERTTPVVASNPATPQTMLPAAWSPGTKYQIERDARLRAAQQRIVNLPPQSRAKVEASLAALASSLQDIQSALGKDPANALLQELLVNTYQDEMRVLVDIETARAPNVTL